jgi:hypothetical protein
MARSVQIFSTEADLSSLIQLFCLYFDRFVHFDEMQRSSPKDGCFGPKFSDPLAHPVGTSLCLDFLGQSHKLSLCKNIEIIVVVLGIMLKN